MILTYKNLIDLLKRYGNAYVTSCSDNSLRLEICSDVLSNSPEPNIKSVEFTTSEGHSLTVNINEVNEINRVIISKPTNIGISVCWSFSIGQFIRYLSQFGRRFFLEVRPSIEISIAFEEREKSIHDGYEVPEIFDYRFKNGKSMILNTDKNGEIYIIDIT